MFVDQGQLKASNCLLSNKDFEAVSAGKDIMAGAEGTVGIKATHRQVRETHHAHSGIPLSMEWLTWTK